MTKKQKRVYDQEYRSKNKYKIKADKAAEYREDPSKAKRRAKYRRERLPSVVLQEKLKWQKEHPENRKRIVRKDSSRRSVASLRVFSLAAMVLPGCLGAFDPTDSTSWRGVES